MRASLLLVSEVKTEGCDTERIETRATGLLRKTEDGCSLRYTEKTEGGTLTCALSFSKAGVVRMTRTGAICSDMLFAVGKTHTSVYRVPPLSLPLSVRATAVSVQPTERGFFISVNYESEIGGARQRAHFTADIQEAL